MVEFVSRYEKFEGLEYDPRVIGHGAVYGSSQSGKSHLVKQLCLNGMFRHCKTLVFLNGKCSKMNPVFIETMKSRWNTLVYSYQITSETQLITKINEIEDAFLLHRSNEYKSLKKTMPEEVDMRPGMEFANLKIIMDDLHKEVVKSETLARKFQSVRHSGIELLFVTQSFKNINMHDLIKENLMFVIIFKLSQNKVTLNGYLSDLSMISSRSRATNVQYRSSLEYIYNRLVLMNDSILGFTSDETSYLYIAMPKRTCKKVSDVRTAITNPNSQICFKEIDCNSCKILFSERKIPLNYSNRMKAIPMKVMSEREQADRFQNANNGDAMDLHQMEDTFPMGDRLGSPDHKHEESEQNENCSGRTGFSGSNSKNKSSLVTHKKLEGKRKLGGLSQRESDSSDHSDSTDIPSDEDDIFFKEGPPCKRPRNMNKARSIKTLSRHFKRELQRSPSRTNRKIQENNVRSITNKQTPMRKQWRRKVDCSDRSKTRINPKYLSGKNNDNIKCNHQRKQHTDEKTSTSSNSDYDE